MKKLLVLGLIGCTATAAYAQKNKKQADKAPVVAANDGFTKTPNNLEYKIVRDIKEGMTPKVGDYLELHIRVSANGTSVGDTLLYDSRAVMDNKPVPYQLPAPSFKGDLPEGLMLLTAGDSAVFRMVADSIPMGDQKPTWFRGGTGQKIIYNISMVSVKTQEQMMKDQETASAAQKGIDDKIIADYLAKNNIKAQKTASGLYYKIDKPGAGENAKAGQKVTVNYTGKTLDGKTFDSNVDPAFQHVQPFSFVLGMGQVIKGWDEGVALLKKGGKGTLYIPSTLAYGSQGAGGAIKPNTVLMFDVEVTDIAAQ
ncbi:FKBP-type peptidyl-prolyl cis-trans isomerase [Polluticoccus soli]|uniref:FKBP-type peptidyl-prolyl cis-trans isomerase n=1 Tax=Polluticoccus soli TaxID=3034150 RepID=UPI0023E1EDDD|nr:FKBP-type peptidyl-prolyl cis-trans isomerase [Flavipsychrobacter sp. JY13-12]